jgi:hypothetical protein
VELEDLSVSKTMFLKQKMPEAAFTTSGTLDSIANMVLPVYYEESI